jgi:hypothetical protein
MSVIADRREDRRRSRRAVIALSVTGLAGLSMVAQAPPVAVAKPSPAWTPQVALVPFAGDVGTLGSNGSLIAVDPRSTPAAAPLFSFEGTPLGLTWGQFDAATATSYAWTLTRRGTTRTDLRITMAGLIPNGVYSLFYRTFGPDTANPICPAVESLVALPARFPHRQKPDPSSFVADSSGGAVFHARVAGALLNAAQVQIWVIYHLDGQVYGPVPNSGESANCRPSYGLDAMRQLIIIQK